MRPVPLPPAQAAPSLPPGTWCPSVPHTSPGRDSQDRLQPRAWTHRLLHFAGQLYKFSGVRVLIGVQKVLVCDPQVAIKDLLDPHVPVCARPGKKSERK